MVPRVRSTMAVLMSALAVLMGCVDPVEFGSPTVEVEEFDAQLGLRALRHERDLDFAWMNLRSQYVAHLRIPGRDGETEAICNAVLVGPDLVLTAAHCIRATEFLDDSCVDTPRPGGRRGYVVFDDRTIQDTSERRPIDRINIEELVAEPGTATFARSGDGSETNPFECKIPDFRRDHDMVLLRLARPIGLERGWARLRAAQPEIGRLMPVIRHFNLTEPTQVSVVRIREALPGLPGNIPPPTSPIGSQLLILEGFLPITQGASGAPLFDEEGYVVGIVSADPRVSGEDAVVFANVASVLSLPQFRAALLPREEVSGFALGQFTGPSTFGGLSLERATFGAGIELPRAIVERRSGGFVTAGYATNNNGQHVLALAGYEADGDLDLTFGDVATPGRITHDIGDADGAGDERTESLSEEIFDVAAREADGESRLVAVVNVGGPDALAVVGLNEDGTLDTSFGESAPGLTIPPVLASSAAAVKVAPDGSIFAAGHAAVEVVTEDPDTGASVNHGPHESPVLVRLLPDGTLDGRCGSNGVFVWRPEGTAENLDGVTTVPELAIRLEQIRDTVAAPSYDMVVTDMALDPVGGIVFVGHLHQDGLTRRDAWVGRLNPDCTPDQNFGPSTTGVTILEPSFFTGLIELPANSWLDAVTIDQSTRTIYAGGNGGDV